MYTGRYNHTHFVFEIMNTKTKRGVHITVCGPEMAKFLFEMIDDANKADEKKIEKPDTEPVIANEE